MIELADQSEFLIKAIEDNRLLNVIPVEDSITKGIIDARGKVLSLAKEFLSKIAKGPEKDFKIPEELFRTVFKKGVTFAVKVGFDRGKADVRDTTLSFVDEAIEKYANARIEIESESLSSYATAQVRRAIADGLYDLENRAQLTKRVEDALGTISPSTANRIARELASIFSNEGRLSAYTLAGVKKVEFVAVPTHCPICDEFAGKIYTLSEAKGRIPVHPRCRCSWIAVFE